MIKSFQDKETQNIYSRERSRRLPDSIQQIALRKLRMLNNAATLNDLRTPPSNRLEKLFGNRSGQYSIRIMIVGGFVFAGIKAMLTMSKLSITIEVMEI